MGGKALKKVRPVRLPREKYLIVEKEVVDRVKSICHRRFVPRYSETKPDFGDMDIIVIPKDPSRFSRQLQDIFSPREMHRSGDIYSLDYMIPFLGMDGDSFQIDFIPIPEPLFDVACFYLSFNDFGAILGGILKPWGFRFGHLGLSHDVLVDDDRTQKIKTIFVSSEPKTICEIAGIDPDFILNFIDIPTGGASPMTWDPIFDWLTRSPLFRSDYWCSRSLYWNHDERKRAAMRPMYKDFLFRYIPDKFAYVPVVEYKEGEEKVKFITVEEKMEFVETTLTEQGLWGARVQALEDHLTRLVAKKKYSGEIVGKLTGLAGKDLGAFMAYLKAKNPDTLGSHVWIAGEKTTQDEINKLILSGQETYEQENR